MGKRKIDERRNRSPKPHSTNRRGISVVSFAGIVELPEMKKLVWAATARCWVCETY